MTTFPNRHETLLTSTCACNLLSHRLVAPRTINLDGVFGLLPNNAWTNLGPVPVADMQETRLRARTKGNNSRSSGSTSSPPDRYVVPSESELLMLTVYAWALTWPKAPP